MPDLNLDTDYFDHPKTMRLVGILGRGSAEFPIRLWAYCGKFHAADGRLAGYGAGEIESVLRWWGEAGALVSAMVKVGFLDVDGPGYRVHGWEERQGHIEALRQRGRDLAERRWGKIRGDAPAMRPAMPAAIDTAMLQPTVPTNQLHQPPENLQEEALGGKTSPHAPLPDPAIGPEPWLAAPGTLPGLPPDPPKQRRGRQGPFVPPSLEEVRAYIQAQGYGVDPEKWHDHYTSNGWRVGKNPMVDWKAAVRTWAKGGRFDGENSTGRSGKAGGGHDPARKAGLAGLSKRHEM